MPRSSRRACEHVLAARGEDRKVRCLECHVGLVDEHKVWSLKHGLIRVISAAEVFSNAFRGVVVIDTVPTELGEELE